MPERVRARTVESVEALGASLVPVRAFHHGAAPGSDSRPHCAHSPSAGGRVTVGDVAARAALTVPEAESAVRALAADTGAVLKVSQDGDLLYVFPSGVRAKLAAKSWRLRLAPLLKQAGEAGNWVLRIAFGAALLVSLAVVMFAILTLSSSASSSRDNDRGRRGGGGASIIMRPGMGVDPFWDPYYMRRRRVEVNSGGESTMGFLESVFSFVFGDGSPEELDTGDLDTRRWRAVGDLIRKNKGVVTAEQLAPLLDLPPGGPVEGDESYVLPALVRLNGVPDVTQDGHILYRFPDLAKTASSVKFKVVNEILLEREQVLTKAPPNNVVLAVAFGAANAFGVYKLGSMMMTPEIVAMASKELVASIATVLPGLQLYAATFFLVPAVRSIRLWFANARINERNKQRQTAYSALKRPRPQLQAKLIEAQQRASLLVFDEEKAVFSSDAPDAGSDNELAEFDARLNAAKRSDKRKI